MSELGTIKREAIGRLSSLKNTASGVSDPERIRQTKVSRFVLKRVSELENESMQMRTEFGKLFALSKSHELSALVADRMQEDHDFEEASSPRTSTTSRASSTSATTTTTMKPEEEEAKIGFDVEALKKLGEEIGKRFDQFGKEAAKNLGDLIEGIKLVFREKKRKRPDERNSTMFQYEPINLSPMIDQISAD